MAHRSLSWRTPHESAYGFTPNFAHLMGFEVKEPILILDEKNHFPNSQEIFGYYDGPDNNKEALECLWVWSE